MMKMIVALASLALSTGSLFSAPAQAGTTFKTSFPRPPAAAVQALNKLVGTNPITAGYVFIDGKYIPPPYKVERYGTVLRINGYQVSNEIVPWSEFIKTQDGVTVTKTEAPASAGGGDDLFGDDAPPEPEPEPEPEVEEEDDDDLASSLDDLFDDDPKPKKTAAKKSAKRKASRPKPKPKPRKPAAVVSYSFEGTFVANEKSKALLDKINAKRTAIDRTLRAGGNFFFSARYSRISGDQRASSIIIDKLPEIMKKYSNREAFENACRQANLGYFPAALMADLHKNRIDYLQLMERRKKDRPKSQW